MLPDEQQVLRILAEAGEPMFPSEIAQALNAQLVAGADYSPSEVIKLLQSFDEDIAQVQDGRWVLRRLLR